MASQLIISRKKQKNFSGSKIKLLCPAKINLYLNILGKYSSGYHRLESVVERISLFDEVLVEVTHHPTIKIFSNCQSLVSKENLIYKAACLMKKEFGISEGFKIYLEKNIPLGSGLGGGSSDAASTILGIKHLFSLSVSQDKLYRLGEKIGSDVNFFLADSSYALLSGRGQRVEPWQGVKRNKYFIIWPGISLSTKKVYENSKAKLTRFFSSVNILKYSLKKPDFLLLKRSIYNCLEKSSFLISAELVELKEIFTRIGIDCFMSGSGSSFYTLDCKGSLEIKKYMPAKWVIFKAQTF